MHQAVVADAVGNEGLGSLIQGLHGQHLRLGAGQGQHHTGQVPLQKHQHKAKQQRAEGQAAEQGGFFPGACSHGASSFVK